MRILGGMDMMSKGRVITIVALLIIGIIYNVVSLNYIIKNQEELQESFSELLDKYENMELFDNSN